MIEQQQVEIYNLFVQFLKGKKSDERYANELLTWSEKLINTGVLKKTVFACASISDFDNLEQSLKLSEQYINFKKERKSKNPNSGLIIDAALSNYRKFLQTNNILEHKQNEDSIDMDFSRGNPIPEKTNKFPISPNSISFDIASFTTDSSYSIRYITSLLAKPFTILTGNSGTGKTRIATQLASWLKKETDMGLTNSLVVPVGADWTDNTKILGYFNPLANNGTGDYVKSDVLNFIELANDNPGIPFFLILDEMNLSHVERYFSDFLSAMESKKPILLYKKPDGCECAVGESVTLPENLFVTGTVNIDETTYMFSPKVLDRANVIEFAPEKDDVLRIFTNKTKDEEISPAPEGMAEAFVELAGKVHNFENSPDDATGKKLIEIIGGLYDILKSAGFEFAYRTTKEIVLYYCAAKSFDPNFDLMAIVDQQIVQKVLPKIHGNKKQIGNMLLKLNEELSNHAEFKLSQAKVQSMIEKLDKFQYASFI